MRVRALRSFAGNGFAGYKGTELEVPDETGADLIRDGVRGKNRGRNGRRNGESGYFRSSGG